MTDTNENISDTSSESDVLGMETLDSEGIVKVIIRLDGEETEVLTSKQRREFRSYEVYDTANYIRNLSGHVSKG